MFMTVHMYAHAMALCYIILTKKKTALLDWTVFRLFVSMEWKFPHKYTKKYSRGPIFCGYTGMIKFENFSIAKCITVCV